MERLCREHTAYRWIGGGVSVNYHTLADFRVAHPDLLDGLLTRSVAVLLGQGLVTLRRVALGGVRDPRLRRVSQERPSDRSFVVPAGRGEAGSPAD